MSIALSRVEKSFSGTRILDDVSLDIASGEFFAVLGPSGCGKTTLLRLVAGLEKLDAGEIFIGGRPVAGRRLHVPPEERNTAIVFQSYALWPHMNVAGNVGYPLRVRGLKGAQRAKKVAEALAAVDLSGFEERRPAELSGGQRQRVALARCLAMDPAVILLDEPLANLDMNLRRAMEDTFKEFHRSTGATMIYVTHDQGEAMAMADRVAVMDGGHVLQVADPQTLYAEPASAMVAGFIGNGQVVDCRVTAVDTRGRATIDLFEASFPARWGNATGPVAGETARLCLRAENLQPVDSGGFAAIVRRATFKGSHVVLDVEPQSAPGASLPVWARHPVSSGSQIRVDARDGWLLPVGA